MPGTTLVLCNFLCNFLCNYATLLGEVVAFGNGRGSHSGADSNLRNVDEIGRACSRHKDNWQVASLLTTKGGNWDDFLFAWLISRVTYTLLKISSAFSAPVNFWTCFYERLSGPHGCIEVSPPEHNLPIEKTRCSSARCCKACGRRARVEAPPPKRYLLIENTKKKKKRHRAALQLRLIKMWTQCCSSHGFACSKRGGHLSEGGVI